MIYPGQYEYWQILWIQIILLVYVQFVTAFSLYTHEESYSRFFRFFDRFFPWKGRDFLIKLHAFSGITVFSLNVLCTTTWFYLKISGGLSILDVLTAGETAVIGWINLASTTLISLMFVFGVSLYKNNRPDTKLPFWRFEYYLSRVLHRLVFLLIVVILGYHIFFISKIFSAWCDWILIWHPFALIPITSIIIGILAFMFALVLFYEIITNKIGVGKKIVFSKHALLLALIFVFYVLYLIFIQPLPVEPFIFLVIFLTLVHVLTVFKAKKVQSVFYNFKTIPKGELTEKLSKMRSFYGEKLDKAIEDILKHALMVWKESMDFVREAEFCGSIFADLSLRKEVDEINELEDVGKMLAMFVWQKMSNLGIYDASMDGFISELKKELRVIS